MKVQRIRLGPSYYHYLLIGDDHHPIDNVNKYLKYLSNIRKSPNTVHTYCTALKFFYEFMTEYQLTIEDLKLYDLSNYIIWLSDYGDTSNMYYLEAKTGLRSAKTINLYITVVSNYLRFLYQSDIIAVNTDEVLYQVVSNSKNPYKDFLFHISKEKLMYRRILKLKEPKKENKRLSPTEIEKIAAATTNIRDELLIRLLSTTGLRIGEALGINHSDLFRAQNGEYKLLVMDRDRNINQSRSKSGKREVFISQDLMDLYDDYCYYLELKQGYISDYVFVKLKGENAGKPMDSSNVNHLFKVLKMKTGINVHPHLFRSTYGSVSYEITKDIEYVRETLGHKQIQTTIESYVFPKNSNFSN